jgi:hypothetical protein
MPKIRETSSEIGVGNNNRSNRADNQANPGRLLTFKKFQEEFGQLVLHRRFRFGLRRTGPHQGYLG